MTKHVTQDDLEKLALGKLRTVDSIRAQRHIFNCGDCLGRLVHTTFVLAQRGLTPPEPIALVPKRRRMSFVHDTADGLIFSKSERQGRKWIARHWGDQLQGGRDCKTVSEANEFLVASFHQMFPEHRCTERCCSSSKRNDGRRILPL